MARWKSSFDNQQISQTVQQSVTALEGLQIEGLSQQDLEEYHRLLKVLKVLMARFSKLDPELFSQNNWSNFANWLSNALTNIKNFIQTRNIGHLQNANNSIDNILNVIRPVDAGATIEEFKSIADANATFQNKIIEELERVRLRGKEVKSQLDSLSNSITQAKTRLDQNDQTIQQQKARLDQSIAEYQKQFSEAQEKRTKDFADAVKRNSEDFASQNRTFETLFSEAVKRRKDEYEKFLEDVRKQNNTHIEFLQRRQDEVNKIFGAIGTAALAGNFKNTADREATAANYLRWIALGLMGAMVFIAIWAFTFSLTHPTDWEVFAFRLGTCIILAIPAFYAANESSKHRERERLNRKVHLELSAIDAYLVLLPEQQRNDIKAKLTDRFFGVPEPKHEGDSVTKKDLFGMLSNAVNNLTKGK